MYDKIEESKKTQTCFFVRDSYIDNDAGHSVATATFHFNGTYTLSWRFTSKLRSMETPQNQKNKNIHTHTHKFNVTP